MARDCRTLLLLAPLVAALGGCAPGRPIDAWQDSLSRYIEREGHGDPSILRDSPQLRSSTALRPAVIRFSKLDVHAFGLPPFNDTWDVHGVMLDTGSEVGCAFLVGVVKRPRSGSLKLEDVRLVLCEFDRSDIRWTVSKRDPQALETYVQRASAPEDGLPRHPTHQVFPAVDDVFRFEVQSGEAVATHVRSGATWRVTVNNRAVFTAR